MPNLRRPPEKKFHQTKDTINQRYPEAKPRDDLAGAFSGYENDALSSKKPHSTHLKDRNTKDHRDRTPKR